MTRIRDIGSAAIWLSVALAQCPEYTRYSTSQHQPLSSGRYALSSMRPSSQCRTFAVPAVDAMVAQMNSTIADPDLYRLFANSLPNTLDTSIKWKGNAKNSDEELAFVITGDIDAMWLRDSANQLRSYVSFLQPSSDAASLASLFRGVINLQARYIIAAPFCNAFQPPPESGIPVIQSGSQDTVFPPYDNNIVHECKFELDSLASFLQVSSDYYLATNDTSLFSKYNWVPAIETIMNTTLSMMTSTYGDDGSVLNSPYTWMRNTNSASETLNNHGAGNPVQSGTGLIRSAFRPSDDACIFQFLISSNMMFSHYLGLAADIMDLMPGGQELGQQMRALSTSLRTSVMTHAVVQHPKHGSIFAYETDGFGSQNMMDDANLPSLLSMPMFGFGNSTDVVYTNTRNFILSSDNPYFMRGSTLNAVGGPHDGPGMAWPMASIVRILTSDNDSEIFSTLKELVASTAGLGLIHESINTSHSLTYTRPWFSWANGLFGEMILDLASRKPALLQKSYQ